MTLDDFLKKWSADSEGSESKHLETLACPGHLVTPSAGRHGRAVHRVA
jgi:hypothetical protein